MTHRICRIAGLLILLAAGLAPAKDAVVATFAVNEYFGLEYDTEPVFFDVTLEDPVAVGKIALTQAGRFVPFQVEILEGEPGAVGKARVWTNVTFRHVEDPETGKTSVAPGADRHKVFSVVLTDREVPAWTSEIRASQLRGAVCPLAVSQVTNRTGFAAVVPTGSATFKTPISAFKLPGPVLRVSRDGAEWIGSGYLDAMPRVESVTCRTATGPVFFESEITYRFEGDRRYVSRVRVFANKPYVHLTEDFNLGGAARFVFNYDDWKVDGFFYPGDQRLANWESITASNPAGDFVRIEGQKALARMVIWSQFNYFRGKQETIAVKAADRKALAAYQQRQVARFGEKLTQWNRKQAEYHQAVQAYQKQLAAYKEAPDQFRRKPKAPRKPRGRAPEKPETPRFRQTTYRLAGAPIPTSVPVTPGGQATAVGAFYARPDRWTRAKVNHVDLYMRPEVPGDRMTRGVVGLDGARQRLAMEAWLVDGHREWAIFAVPAGDDRFLAKAHVVEGVWPLRRLNRLDLVWNSDGSAVKPEDTMPSDTPVGGPAGAVLLGMGGRSGLQYFNGSNGQIRWTPPTDGFDGTVTETRARPGQNDRMVAEAITCYMASDDSAYPSLRAMLPWTHPEAINPFYQGMENMNFNADLYRYVAGHAVRLLEMGHPEGKRFLDHAEQSFDRALDTYVYPESGCWEESHGYANHTLKVTGPLAELLKNSGRRNFLTDIRYARMARFFLDVHSPIDAEFGNRVVPPVGDHGLSKDGPARRFERSMKLFGDVEDPEIRRIVEQMAWMIREQGGAVPETITPKRPDLTSRWLRGYGTVMRGFGRDLRGWKLLLKGGVGVYKKDKTFDPRDLALVIPIQAAKAETRITGTSPQYNRARHTGTAIGTRKGNAVQFAIDLEVGSDRWVKGGPGRYTVTLTPDGENWTGRFEGTFQGRAVKGQVEVTPDRAESFVVLRAGQSWGHHHEDKGSLWFWGRNVHFFGDCSWGRPPGGTYWNPFKQGPASGTQIELVGVTNWTLPCKYPAPWISDEQYADGVDYANARCMFPFNPALDVSESTPVALRNGYDRQVLLVHPDVLIVRDNVESNCPTVWRLHSYQKDRTSVDGAGASLQSLHGVTGQLRIVYPQGVRIETMGKYPPINPNTGQAHKDSGKAFESLMLRWAMPAQTDATWVFGVHGDDESAPTIQRLDKQGRVTRVALADGTEIIALMDIEPFQWRGGPKNIEFVGTVGLVVTRDGKTTTYPIRARTLEVHP